MTRYYERFTTYAVPIVLLGSTIFLLYRSQTAEESAYAALKMCATVIIPSLFPYMVISSMLVRTGAAGMIGRWISRPVLTIFRLPGCAGGAFLLGALCGFPVGAKTACELYESGSLSRRECERLIAIANNTGPSFVIEVVGAHFWGSRGMGLVIYLAQILSSVLIGWTTSRREIKSSEMTQPATKQCDLLQCLATSVSHSARSVVTVCGFIVFFAVVTSLAHQVLVDFRLSLTAPMLGALLEFSTGASLAAGLGGISGAFFTGFAVGWSGLSVFAQCKAFTTSYGISLRFTAVCKLVQGLLTGAAAVVYYALCFHPSTTAATVIPIAEVSPAWIAAEFLLLTAASIPLPRRKSSVS